MSSTPAARWIADTESLLDLVEELRAAPRYAIDTEFHRERTYYPRLALVQLAWPGGTAIVDPLAVDVKPLATVLDGPGLAILHAAQQDMEVLARSCGTVPARLFDTQLAAGFLGYSTPSLVNLLSAELQVRLPKGDRLTDWLRRPLSPEQLAYAEADVAHLLPLHDALTHRLEQRGRLAWALDECEALRSRPVGPSSPEEAWFRLKDARSLRGRSRDVARAVAAWRERRAAALDVPVRTVLPDLGVLGVAQRAPRTSDELRHCRGLDERHTRGKIADELLVAVQHGIDHPVGVDATAEEPELDRHLRPAVTLVSAWVSQLARHEQIDTGLLATRSDLVSLLAGDPQARLATGWRADVLGDDLRRLVAGEAALAFDGKGGLRLLAVP